LQSQPIYQWALVCDIEKGHGVLIIHHLAQAHVMPEYRLYVLNTAGKIDSPALTVQCEDDATALVVALEKIENHAFEIWDGARRVAAIPRLAAD
jgi:hypothetical protein